MTQKRAAYYHNLDTGKVVQIADDLGHLVNPAQDDAPNLRWYQYNVAVGVAAVQLSPGGPTPNNRQSISVCNLGPAVIYVGASDGGAWMVTAANGFPIMVGETKSFPFGSDLVVWAISAGAGNDVRVMELW